MAIPKGKIRVGKYNYQSQFQPSTKGYVNILIHTSGPLSPYIMKDGNGVIMENYWQFSKIFPTVYQITQLISRYDLNRVRWEHPQEDHIDDHGNLTVEYWRWREKGFKHDKWVRYPNGYNHHSEAAGSIVGTLHNYTILTYIEARKMIYYPKYREIAIGTRKFKELYEMVRSGINIQINEVDGPTYGSNHPYNLVKNGSLKVTPEILEKLINDPNKPFGHGYALAAALLDISEFD